MYVQGNIAKDTGNLALYSKRLLGYTVAEDAGEEALKVLSIRWKAIVNCVLGGAFMKEEEKSEAKALWLRIVSFLKRQEGHSYEFKTVRLGGRDGIWFSASVEGDSIIVDRAVEHEPSGDINGAHFITSDEFTRVYPFYGRWLTREIPRHEIRNIDLNTSYIFALTDYFKSNETE